MGRNRQVNSVVLRKPKAERHGFLRVPLLCWGERIGKSWLESISRPCGRRSAWRRCLNLPVSSLPRLPEIRCAARVRFTDAACQPAGHSPPTYARTPFAASSAVLRGTSSICGWRSPVCPSMQRQATCAEGLELTSQRSSNTDHQRRSIRAAVLVRGARPVFTGSSSLFRLIGGRAHAGQREIAQSAERRANSVHIYNMPHETKFTRHHSFGDSTHRSMMSNVSRRNPQQRRGTRTERFALR